MYIYDQYDQQIVDERVAQYRDQTQRFLAGDISEEEFLPLRLQNGLYVQRLAPMLRIAVPYGLLSSSQLRKLAHISRQYDKGYVHFTTRQNIQLNWPQLEEVPDIQNNTKKSFKIKGDIDFKNVSLVYDDTKIKALKNISFSVKKGETIAILGKTGSGKSSILNLITRLYDVSEGIIQIDNTPIKEVNLIDLRNAIGFVPQDPFLFSDSISNNIKFGQEQATKHEIISAAKKAVVHENIERFKDKYDTILGERGVTLSGGQKQRVSIARAIIKNPKILVFDDCLSAVDTETEERILANLESVSKDKTTFIISHRVSSAKNADKIIVLDDGEIIQQGSHNQLINQNGYYKELFEQQLLEKENL